MDYEVSFLSTNKVKIKCKMKNDTIKSKIKEKQLKGLQQLKNYNLEFINHSTDNEPITIYLLNKTVLKLAQRILSRSNAIFEQLVNYEMYQKIDQFYLTILTIKNTELVGDPIFPVVYLIHEQNDEKTHSDFWNKLVLKYFNYSVPITVSKENCIMNSVLECLQNSTTKMFFCSNQIVKDVNQFCSNHSIEIEKEIKFKSDEYKLENFTTGIENLVSCETFLLFEEILEEFRSSWTEEYSNYFKTKIKPLIVNNLVRKKASNLRANLTVLASEKKYSLETFDDKEFSLTDLILKLYKSSCELMIKFNEVYTGQEKTLNKLKYKYLPYLKNLAIHSKYVDYLDDKKKKNNLSCLEYFKPKIIFNLFHFQIADLVIKNDLIFFDQLNNVYLVKSPFDEQVHSVYDNEGKTECTCSKINICCFHKIAAKFKFISES